MQNIFTPEQLKLLETPLTKEEIDLKDGARYITSFAAIRKANLIFGPGNWGYSITSPFELVDTGKTTKAGSVIFRVRVAITLEVRGCMPITDIGDCEAMGSTAPAMSMAEKGAVSDGVKRCLRIYGPAFGLDLYDKDWQPEDRVGYWLAELDRAKDMQALTAAKDEAKAELGDNDEIKKRYTSLYRGFQKKNLAG
jgi:recombination DNA repair RAD52 pathway protein